MIQKIVLGLAIIMLIINILNLNFDDLSWKINKHSYMNIITMLLVILSMILTIKQK